MAADGSSQLRAQCAADRWWRLRTVAIFDDRRKSHFRVRGHADVRIGNDRRLLRWRRQRTVLPSSDQEQTVWLSDRRSRKLLCNATLGLERRYKVRRVREQDFAPIADWRWRRTGDHQQWSQ